MNKLKIVWKGKPKLLPYLFANKKLFRNIVGALMIFAYEKFEFLFFSQICIFSWIFYFLHAIISWKILTYYITVEGPVVQRRNTYYRLHWNDMRIDEYYIYGNFFEKLFGCRTFEFSRCYITSNKNDKWREKARFWGIKEHEQLKSVINKYLS